MEGQGVPTGVSNREVDVVETLSPHGRHEVPQRPKASLTCSTTQDQFSVTEQFFSGHGRFTFSILQLLNAVRMALLVPSASASDEHSTGEGSGQVKRNGLSSFTIQEIVQHVERRPGDPKILQTEEPLQDLVKAVLNIKSWTGLAAHDTSTGRWDWIGPVPSMLKSESWGISPKILPELIDSFAEWMIQRQETTELIRSLPPPPESLIENPDMEERYRLRKRQKNPNTISPSSEEVKAYFHREEALRYTIPDSVFPYTARDATKCPVAPVRRGNEKSSVIGRNHYLLKRTRPDYFSLCCLVRDAAARLPGRNGTRADISTLVRDSQYIVENIPEGELQQIVRRCLDRLRYEIDPCVLYDKETKLWVYLHGDRTDLDFMDHGPCPSQRSEENQTEQ